MNGHYSDPPGMDRHVVYVAQLEDGSNNIYTLEEFAKQFGWKNEPKKASFLKLDP